MPTRNGQFVVSIDTRMASDSNGARKAAVDIDHRYRRDHRIARCLAGAGGWAMKVAIGKVVMILRVSARPGINPFFSRNAGALAFPQKLKSAPPPDRRRY